LEGRGLGERLGAHEILIYGTGEEILVGDRGAYPKKLGSGEILSTEPSRSRLGFMLSHIRFDWLRSGCAAVGLFFGSDTVMFRVAE
jgi:hypothetical protein